MTTPEIAASRSPGRAPVVPRGQGRHHGEVLPVADFVRPFIEECAVGLIAIVGPRGSGKTTALADLSAEFGARKGVVFLDPPGVFDLESRGEQELVIYTTNRSRPESHLAMIRLASWGTDEAIEFLLATRRARCASVMNRLQGDADRGRVLQGSPVLFRAILEEMADDESLSDATEAILARLKRLLPSEQDRWSLGSRVLESALGAEAEAKGEMRQLIRLQAPRSLLAGESLLADLRRGIFDVAMGDAVNEDLIRATARLGRGDAEVTRNLEELASSDIRRTHASAVSLLLAIDADWSPSFPLLPRMNHALLAGARWAMKSLRKAELDFARLDGADLSLSDLSHAELRQAHLSGTRLVQADLTFVAAREADFSGADLSHAKLLEADVRFCWFAGACLRGANLGRIRGDKAVFAGADLRDADLSRARIERANLEEADLRRANLTEAEVAETDLRTAKLDDAIFEKADLTGCNLEGVEIRAARFAGANLSESTLTDSVMPHGDFHDADLSSAGLAGVSWEGANLRCANFDDASFHLGSSRSGLVDSPIAGEGSRTGFYTDEALEDSFRDPAEIRKADLRRANLAGARVTGTDWYLVDLRGAKYSPDQEQHFRRCRAILEDRK